MTQTAPNPAPTPPPPYIVSLCGQVTPPDDLLGVARLELSAEGFERLMLATGGHAPTSRQLCCEVEFERTGAYPREEISTARAIAIAQEAALIATARAELSQEGFRALMTRTDWQAPTSMQLCEAVEAERAAAQRPTEAT